LKFIGAKSNSTDKNTKIKSKFGQYNNYSKHYCITLNQYAQYKQDYLSLNSHSNSKNKNNSNSNRNKVNRPSTAPQKNKNNQKKKNNGGNEHKNNFIGFNGIVNIRTNLITNNKNNGFNNNNKYKIKDNNNGFSTLFNPSNTFTNNIMMNTSIGFNNRIKTSMGNNNGHSRTLFGNNNKRITSPRIFINQTGFKAKKQNNGTRIRLSSAITNNNAPLVNTSQKKRKII
jgi:hypothetical protein